MITISEGATECKQTMCQIIFGPACGTNPCIEASSEEVEAEKVRKCQYQCGDTKSFKIQYWPFGTSNVCPDQYAELESYGMLVCTELNIPTIVANTEYGLNEYVCVYDKCKRTAYFSADDHSSCPSYETINDLWMTSECSNKAGDVLIDEDKMFIELENQSGQVRKCQYLCDETMTKSIKVQCPSCTSNVCPDKYAELESYGMLVCTELTATSEENTEYGLEEYDCVYEKCKKIAYFSDDYSVCPLPAEKNDFSDCRINAGDLLIDEDQMFIELEDMWN